MQSDPIGIESGENSFIYVGGNPLVRVDESGLLTVYVWNFRGSKEAWGHSAMTLEDGTHISWWPKNGAGLSNFWKDIEAAELPSSINKDIQWEGMKYNYSKTILFLDEYSIKVWWNKFKSKRIYNAMFRNCSTAVVEGLKAGGANYYADITHIVWTPNDIKEYVNAIIDSFYNSIIGGGGGGSW